MPDSINLQRCLEIDADLLALGLLIELLSNEELADSFLFPYPQMNDPHRFGQSVYLLMRMLELWRQSLAKRPYHSASAAHPHPEIRQLFVDAWFISRNKEDRNSAFFEVGQKFQAGMEEMRNKIAGFGPHFLTELQYIIAQGRDLALEEYEKLRLDLEGYLKPGLASFRVPGK